MVHRFFLYLTAAVVAGSASAQSATLSIMLNDSHGRPAADAVVMLSPVGASSLSSSHVPAEATIDQRRQMFSPLVVVVRRGGRVVFTNNDDTMHQVYSFSAIRKFEYEIEKGHRSEPVVFDKPGVAAIGCNIHDNMIAYVVVSDAPVAAVTDAKGRAVVADVAPGDYQAEIWHPRLVPGPAPTMKVTVAQADISLVRTLSLLSDKMSGMHKQHQQTY